MKKVQTSIRLFLLLLLCAQSPKLFSAASAKDSSDFILAAEQGDVKKVQGFLDKGIAIETKDLLGYTVLMRAANNNQLEVVELLLKNCADINSQSSYAKAAALHCASERGYTSIIDFLYMHKADINSQDIDKDTSLMIAGLYGQTLAVKHLLSLGADYSLKNTDNIDLELLLSKKVLQVLDKKDIITARVFKKHKDNLSQLIALYKKDTTIPQKGLLLFFPPKEYPGSPEEQLARHQTDIVSIKKVLFVAELDPIFNEINLLGEMADYLEPFIEE